jgi:MFS family permease
VAVADGITEDQAPADHGRHPAQRRVLTVLIAAQVLGGIGVGTGIAVSTLVAANLSGSEAIGGLAQTTAVLGAAALAVPMARTAVRHGRRAGLSVAYTSAFTGMLTAAVAVALGWWPLLLAGLFLAGGGSAASLAARYAATDLSPPGHTARDLSLVVWATTVGTIAGPNLAEPADRLGRTLGMADWSGPYAISAVAFGLTLVGVWPCCAPTRCTPPVAAARRPARGVPRRAAGRCCAPHRAPGSRWPRSWSAMS